jgi:hypothetical protein
MSLFRPKSTLARAVMPVVGGLIFFAVLAAGLWGIAALSSSGEGETSDLLADRTFQPGPAESYARLIDEDGPILFPDLTGTDGDESVVLDHTGDDPLTGWRLYLAHPADKPLSCKVEQVEGTRQFVDCDGREIDVDALATPARGIGPALTTDGTLTLDLTPAG